MNKGYSAKAVANYFLIKDSLTYLKVQKLVYLAHGWYLAYYNGEPLIYNEYAEAWKYGPVFPSLYHEFKRKGTLFITEPASEINLNLGKSPKLEIPRIPKTDTETRKFLDKIWEVYGPWEDFQLSELLRRDGTPWKETIDIHGSKTNGNIEDKTIARFYINKLEQHRRNMEGE